MYHYHFAAQAVVAECLLPCVARNLRSRGFAAAPSRGAVRRLQQPDCHGYVVTAVASMVNLESGTRERTIIAASLYSGRDRAPPQALVQPAEHHGIVFLHVLTFAPFSLFWSAIVYTIVQVKARHLRDVMPFSMHACNSNYHVQDVACCLLRS